jgi:hypothetical protein
LRGLGDSVKTSPARLAFPDAPEFAAIGTTYAGVEVMFPNGGRIRELHYTFPTPHYLAPGMHWISAWVQEDLVDYDQALYLRTTETIIRGSQAYYQNPGGGEGFGTASTPISDHYGLGSFPPADFAFTIRGSVVPEPGLTAWLIGLIVPCMVAYLRCHAANR